VGKEVFRWLLENGQTKENKLISPHAFHFFKEGRPKKMGRLLSANAVKGKRNGYEEAPAILEHLPLFSPSPDQRYLINRPSLSDILIALPGACYFPGV
jgi:hypothetical protein